MVSCLMFKSLSHFEFIFAYGVRVCSNFIDLHVAVQLPHLSFSHCKFLPLLSKIDCRCVGLFLGSLLCSIGPYICFCASTMCCFDYCSFVVLSEVWEGYISCFVLFPQDCFGNILGLLWFHVNFRVICSSSVKNVMGNLIGIALNL